MYDKYNQRGASLIELIMFIVIIGIALSGILLVMNNVSGHSADALVRKQAIAIAESLLEEIQLQNFAKPAGGFSGAATSANRASFDTVIDYIGYTTTAGIVTVNNNAIAGLNGYNITAVTVAATAMGGAFVPAADAYLITVTVTDPQGNLNTVVGYRTRY